MYIKTALGLSILTGTIASLEVIHANLLPAPGGFSIERPLNATHAIVANCITVSALTGEKHGHLFVDEQQHVLGWFASEPDAERALFEYQEQAPNPFGFAAKVAFAYTCNVSDRPYFTSGLAEDPQCASTKKLEIHWEKCDDDSICAVWAEEVGSKQDADGEQCYYLFNPETGKIAKVWGSWEVVEMWPHRFDTSDVDKAIAEFAAALNSFQTYFCPECGRDEAPTLQGEELPQTVICAGCETACPPECAPVLTSYSAAPRVVVKEDRN